MITVLITKLTILKKWSHTWKIKTINQKKKFENCKTLTTILESVDSNIIIGVTSASITLSFFGVGLNILPISAWIACTSSLTNKIIHKIILNQHNKKKKNIKKINKQLKLLINHKKKFYKVLWLIKMNMIFLCNIFTKHLDGNKYEFSS